MQEARRKTGLSKPDKILLAECCLTDLAIEEGMKTPLGVELMKLTMKLYHIRHSLAAGDKPDIEELRK